MLLASTCATPVHTWHLWEKYKKHEYLTTGLRTWQLPEKVVLSMARFRLVVRIETCRHVD
jgi:hypothetical protein